MDFLFGKGLLQGLKVIKLDISTIFLVPGDDKFFSLQGDRKDNKLAEGQNSIIGDISGLTESLLQLLLDVPRRVEKVNLAVRLAGAHLGPREAGHHRVHQVGSLGVTQGGQVLLSVGEDLPLVDPPELSVHPQVLLVQSLEARVEKA